MPLRTGILVENILPALRPMLTPTEYSRVAEKSSNVDGVDELVKILLTRDESTFLKFCKALEHNGYSHWSQALQLRGKGMRIDSLAHFSNNLYYTTQVTYTADYSYVLVQNVVY